MFTAAANHPVRLHQLEKRQRRGSLPLKKRRVSADMELAVNGSNCNSSSPFFAYHKPPSRPQQQQPENSVPTLALLPSQSLLNHPSRLEPFATSASAIAVSFCNSNTNLNDTSKLTALSLIAAAAVASQQESFEASSLSNNEDDNKDGDEDDIDEDEDQEEQELLLSTPGGSISKSGNTASSASSCSSALCHYKNCKRVAGYRNTDFCKLHARSPNEKVSKKTSKKSNTATTTTSPTAAVVTTATAPSTGQDKRYTGGAVEVRCCATTTRGRACAYIAVNDTQYCHMHADYDTNPPPRRGIKSPTPTAAAAAVSTSTTMASSSSNSKHSSSPPKKQSAFAKINSGSSSSSTSVKSTKSSRGNSHNRSTAQNNTNNKVEPLATPLPTATSPSPRRSSAKRAEKHADSPYPLLSMISTDQWFQRKVQVAVGPLQGRTGTVQKWGNGWISVKVPGVAGLHNRRSFELYLHESDDQQQQQSQQQDKMSGKKSSKKRKAKADPPAEALGLFRCISRDVDVVSPSPSTDHSIRSARSFTPKLTSSACSSSSSNNNNKFSPVPETPTPSESSLSHHDMDKSNSSSSICNSFLSPVPQKATAAPPKVTPLLSEDAKPVVSFKSTNCDRLQLPETATMTMKDPATSPSNKAMVFRPAAATSSSN